MAQLTPSSVEQLLEVLDRTRRAYAHGLPLATAYQDAVRDVSNRYHVTYQTIGDFRRRLGLNDVAEYMDLVRRWVEGEVDPLRRKIKHQSQSLMHARIDQFFSGEASSPPLHSVTGSLKGPNAAASGDHIVHEEMRIRISPELQQRLRLAHLARIGETLEQTAVALIEAGFESEKTRIKAFLHTVGAT